MKVRLCERCPYVPLDVASHYDPEAPAHLCAGCDDRPAMLTHHYPRAVRRAPKCVRLLEDAYSRSRVLA